MRETISAAARFAGSKWALRTLFWGSVVLAWQLFALWKGPFFLPSVPDTVRGVGSFIADGHYLTLVGSLKQLLLGFAIACAVGIPVGALMGWSRIFDDLISPYIYTLFVTAKEALLPLLIIVVGTKLEYRISVVVMFAFFFPVINTAAGVRFINRDLIETARAFCTPRRRMFSEIILPAAAPYVVAGVRLGLGMALKGMIIAELWVTAGTGGLLKNLAAYRELSLYFATAVMIVILAITANELLSALERKLQPWEKYTRAG